jgi:flagellar biosynthesis/type III secretory pathway protein FliH
MNDFGEAETMLSERFDQWEAEFLQQGRQEGVQEGKAALLRRLLQRRFGELPPSVQERLKDAPPAQLERWGDRLLDAHTLTELLEG